MLRRKDSVARKTRKNLPRLDDLVLHNCKLKFYSEQLQNLNFLFERKLDEMPSKRHVDEDKLPLAISVVERLIQRLVCGVGIIDPNFASKYLIHLHENNVETTSLQYLLRLDNLSTPTLYDGDSPPAYAIVENDPDFPKGYARVRAHPQMMKNWGIFTNNEGYLRRDKIQAKYVELLATAAASDMSMVPNELDESILCASPGKVVDAFTLRQILRRAPEEHVYFGGNGSTPRFPDPRDFRLAIVDEPGGIRIRLEFLSPALSSTSMNVRLLIGIESDAWPASTDFPGRVPLGHPDSLLYNEAGQMGAYLVGYGVQSSAWQVRFPAAEELLMWNYSKNSAVSNIFKLSERILDEIYEESARHQKYQYTYRILNSYIFKTALLYELEKDFTNPTRLILNWSPRMLSTHILKILDHMVHALKIQRFPNYFYSGANLLVNPGHLCEDDYIYESRRVATLLVQFYHLSLAHNNTQEYERYILSQELELLLLHKWKELIDSLLPPTSTRGRRFCFAGSRTSVAYTQYTARQIEFLALLFQAALAVHNNRIVPPDDGDEQCSTATMCQMDASHDLVYIIVILLRQAKEHFLKTNPSGKVRRKLATGFESCVAKLVEIIRRANEPIADEVDFVKVVLKWLYRALDQNKRLLAPLLRPYLNILFVTSHGNAWFLENIRKRAQCDEVDALLLYNRLVNEERVTPAEALVDCVSKKWIWAKDFLEAIRDQPVRVVFVPKRGKVIRHVMSVPQPPEDDHNDNIDNLNNNLNINLNLNNLNGIDTKEDLNFETLGHRSYFCTLLKNCYRNENKGEPCNVPWYCVLRDSSPMTLIFQQVHRNGDHRCNGDIVQTLLSMQKMNILNEVTSILPADDRHQLMDLLQRFNAEKRRSTLRKRAKTLPVQDYAEKPKSFASFEKYTRTEESAGLQVTRDSSFTDSTATVGMRSVHSGVSNCTSSGGSDDRRTRLRYSQSMKF